MERTDLVGRTYELDTLRQLFNKPEASLIAVYGRRRVGKTYLVRNFCHEHYDFALTGLYETPLSVQLRLFKTTLEHFSGTKQKTFHSWFEAFDALKDYLQTINKKQKVVFLDEIPWMETPRSYFLQAFSTFWNTWGANQHGLKLIVCGSSTTWMLDKFVGDKGGFYGRSNRCIYLSPFTLEETELFLQHRGFRWSRLQIAECYMVLGGIPYYLDMLNPTLPFRVNIDNLFFRAGAPLRQEYDFLFRSLFKQSILYRNVVEVIAKEGKGMTQTEIKERLGLSDGGVLTTVLRNLCVCDFLHTYLSYGKKERNTMYQLSDLYVLFYLRFIRSGDGKDEHFWVNLDENTRNQWIGYAFEQVCFHHIAQIKVKLGISGILTNTFSWSSNALIDKDGTSWKGTQIDMLMERADRIINICEIKYANHPYAITQDYAQHLIERMETFRHHTATKASLHITMITTMGIMHNPQSDIVQSEVTLDDLFAHNNAI